MTALDSKLPIAENELWRMPAIADVVKAVSSHRPYRPALGRDKALEEISRNQGILYDRKVVDACVKAFPLVEFQNTEPRQPRPNDGADSGGKQ